MDLALPIAIVIVAGLAWDVARRFIANKAGDVATKLYALEARIVNAEERSSGHGERLGKIDALARETRERNDAQIKNLLAEVHELLKQHDTKQAGVIAATAGNGRNRMRMRTG